MRRCTGLPAGLKNPHYVATPSGKAHLKSNAYCQPQSIGPERDVLSLFSRRHSYLGPRRRPFTTTTRELCPNAQRSFSNTARYRIRLVDDEEEEEGMDALRGRSRNLGRPVRAHLSSEGSPKDMRTIILSRQKVKPTPIDPRKVARLERQFPDLHHLLDDFLDARFFDVENHLVALDDINRLIRESVIGSLRLSMAQSRQRYRLLQTQFRQTAEENLARIEKGTLDLYLDFLPAEFEEVKTSIDRMRSHIDKEYLLPKESAIRNIDGPLSFSENMNEEYLSLQTESRNVLEGIRQLKSLCSSLQQWDFLRGSRFAEHSRRLAHHRAQFAIAAHMWRSTWMNSQLALNPLQRGQMWSITEFVQFETSNTSPLTLIESTILGDASDEHLKTITKSRNMIATTLQQNYTKRWDGPKPLGSPEMDKAWRQLDVIAPLEMVITLTWWLQTEVSYLIECIQGSFGPMFDHISADMPTKSGLSGLYKRIIDHRKALLKDALEYKYINWMRLQTEEKLHELGMPNEFQAHGFLIPPKPLSQDMTRFLNWTYQYADIANLTWIRSKALELIIRPESEVFPFMARMTRLHKSIYDERVFHVPELGSRRGRMKQAWKAKIARLQQEPTPQSNPERLSGWSSDALYMPFPETTLADSSSTGTIDQPEKKEPQVDSRGGQDALSWMTDILDQRSVHQNRTTGGHKKSKILQRKRVDTRIKGHGPPQTHLSLSDRIFGKEVTPRRSRRKTVSKQNTAPSQPESAPTKPADHLSIKSKGETKGPSADAKKYSSKKQETKARRNRSSFHTSKRVHETRGASRAYSTSRTLQANGGLEESWDCSRELPESGDISDEAGITNKSDPTSAPREVASPESKAVDPASKPLFWSHSSQTRPDGGKLIVHYCRNLESTEEVAKLFHNSPVIGFDMEWKSNASANHSVQSNLSLIQIANEERIALFQIALFKPAKGLSDLVAPSLKLILESPEITKVGVSIKADTTRLRKYLGINAVSIFELSHLFKLVKFGQSNPKLVNKRNINLSDQVEEHLGLPLNKSEDVRCSDWARPLNYNQVQYAATDPYASLCLYNVLEQKRLAMDPVPPRPAYAELNLPITLPHGQAVNAEEKEVPMKSEDENINNP